MISAGNDIVDLSKINSQRTTQPRFFGKMLVPAEVEMHALHKELPFTTYVWLLWSIKEAVFKYHKRNNPVLSFAPRKTIVQELQTGQSTNNTSDVSVRSIVTLDGHTFYGTSYISGDTIHSIASASPEHHTEWGVEYISSDSYEQQSFAVREFFIQHFRQANSGNISVQKNETGCPIVTIDGVVSNVPVSFSHHGNYVAYAYVPQREYANVSSE